MHSFLKNPETKKIFTDFFYLILAFLFVFLVLLLLEKTFKNTIAHFDSGILWILLVLFLLIYTFRRVYELLTRAEKYKEAADDLLEYKFKYYRVFENIKELYCEFLLDGSIVNISPSFMESTAYTREELLGASIFDFFVSSTRKDLLLNLLIKHDSLDDFDIEFKTAWGNIAVFRLNCTLERDDSGEARSVHILMQDITALNKALLLLDKSEKKHRGIFHIIQNIYCEMDIKGKILDISPAIETISSYKREDIIGSSFFDYCLLSNKSKSSFLTRLEEDSSIKDFIFKFKSKEGLIKDFSMNAELVFDNAGLPLYALASIQDISDHKRIEAVLRRSKSELEQIVSQRTAKLLLTNQKLLKEIEDRKSIESKLLQREETFRALTENSTDIIMRFSRDLSLVFVNASISRLLNLSPSEVEGENFWNLDFDRNFFHILKLQLDLIFKDGQERSISYPEIYKDIKSPVYDWHLIPEWSFDSRVVSVLCTGRDISRLKAAEQRIQILTQELLRAQENERQRISRDLHDHIAQDLATLKIMSQNLFRDLSDVPKLLSFKLESLNKTLSNTIQEVRDLAYDLRPPTLDTLGLVRTFFLYCEDLKSKHGLNLDFSSAGLESLNLDFDTEINLYRLLQEALSNVRKHAFAENVSVRLVASYPYIIFKIEDDGKGFDLKLRSGQALEERRMGLRSMEERVALLGGDIKIHSLPGSGTRINIKVPISIRFDQDEIFLRSDLSL